MTAKTKLETSCQIRWMIRRDLMSVVQIEKLCFEFPWAEEDFLNALRCRDTIGMIAERDDILVGVMVYTLHKSRLELLNFAVHPEYQRSGIGCQMVNKLKLKLSNQRRQSIDAVIRETNLDAQLFFRDMLFVAKGVMRDHYEDTTEDGYLFRYELLRNDD